jgi:uncharacterized protein YneF (UPF0154 family)
VSDYTSTSANINLEVVTRDQAMEKFVRGMDDAVARLEKIGRVGGTSAKQVKEGLSEAEKAAKAFEKSVEQTIAKLSAMGATAMRVISDVAEKSRQNAQAGQAGAVTAAQSVMGLGLGNESAAASFVRSVGENPRIGEQGAATMFRQMAQNPRFREVLKQNPNQALSTFASLASGTAYMSPEDRSATVGAFGVASEVMGPQAALSMTFAAQQMIPAEALGQGLQAMRPAILGSKDPGRAYRNALGFIANISAATDDANLRSQAYGVVNDQEYRKYMAARQGRWDSADVLESMMTPSNLRIRTSNTGLEGVGLSVDAHKALMTRVNPETGGRVLSSLDSLGSPDAQRAVLRAQAERGRAAVGARAAALDDAESEVNSARRAREERDFYGDWAARRTRATLERSAPIFASTPGGDLVVATNRAFASESGRRDRGLQTAEYVGGGGGAAVGVGGGAAIGFAVAGPPGAAIGGAVGGYASYQAGTGAGAAVYHITNNYTTNNYNPADGGGATEAN